jgi:hypothetical protein
VRRVARIGLEDFAAKQTVGWLVVCHRSPPCRASCNAKARAEVQYKDSRNDGKAKNEEDRKVKKKT